MENGACDILIVSEKILPVMSSVIVLENEISLREDLVEYLEFNNYQVSVAGSIRQFDALLQTLRPDMVVLERRLPDGDGFEVLRHLRRQGSRCGVVVLADIPSFEDRIDAFEIGADHYLAKPIRMRELLAVLNALAWRTSASAGWRVCPSTSHLFLPSSEAVKLTGQETRFLSYLASHPARAQSRKKIVESLGKSPSQYDYRNLDALVLRLRKKEAQHTANPLPLKTEHGLGYSVSSDVALVDS